MKFPPFAGIIPRRQGRGKRGDDVKHGKAPTVAQKKLLKKWRLNPENWLVVKNQPERMVIVHRFSNQLREIRKG